MFLQFKTGHRVLNRYKAKYSNSFFLFFLPCEFIQLGLLTLPIFLPVPADPSATVSPQVRHLLQPGTASGRRSIVAFTQILSLSPHIHRYGCSLLVISNFWPRHAQLPMKLYTTVLSNFKSVDRQGSYALHKIDISILYIY